jgi:hypothetical protein
LGREKICPSCQRLLEDKFQEVKEYLQKNPNTSVEQTARDNDVTTKQIKQWVREERLVLTSATEAGIVCESCGKPICTGRFCETCKATMANDLMNAISQPAHKEEHSKADRERDRMRFL